VTEIIVFWTVAGAAAAWGASEIVRGAWQRWLWTMAAMLMLVHSVAAFGTIYGWSHTTAVEATARQTRAVTGFESGAGIYVNYAFLVVWLSDVVWWWRAPESYTRRSAGLSRFVHGFVWFMFLNGAVIFADGWMQGLGVAAVTAVTGTWLRQ
jgi:hypothetical protein